MVCFSKRAPLRAAMLIALCLQSAALLSARPALGQSPGLNTLYSFSAVSWNGSNWINTDGQYPSAGLIQGKDGNFYGTAEYGGTNGSGTIFKITTGGAVTTLYSFSAVDYSSYPYTNSDGANPANALVQGKDGNFYGTVEYGGTNGNGTIFKITPGGTFNTLYTFSSSGASDGASPAAGLIQARNGNFYGTCQLGGQYGAGTIFDITPRGKFATLYSFDDVNDGGQPAVALIQASDGNFYGTTTESNNFNFFGTLFQITPQGKFTVLSYLGGVLQQGDPTFSSSLIQGSDGALYGTDQTGGDNYSGEIYKITSDGTFTTVYSFGADTSGASPLCLILARDGNFYGTCSDGTIFKVTPDGTGIGLYNFNDDSVNGGLIQGRDGNLYGTTSFGGANNNGTVFQFNLSYGIFYLSPSSVIAPAPDTPLTVIGDRFTAHAVIHFGATALPTTVVNSNTLTATLPAASLANPAVVPVSVVQNGVTSNSQPFAIVSNPIVTLLSPDYVILPASATLLTVTGANFTAGAVINFGATALPTTVVNSTTLTATIPAASLTAPAVVPVSVVQSGVTSNAVSFSIVDAPILTLQPGNAYRDSSKNVVVGLLFGNVGSATAFEVTITTGTLAAQNTLSRLPLKVKNVAVGSPTIAHLAFPGSVGTKGQTATLAISGNYKGGTYAFSVTITLP